MKISELKNCPHWLKTAITENANVDIVDGIVHWHSGVWHSGVWYNGIWENGDWYGGTWLRGTWKNGVWINGNWYCGTWETGAWADGTWHKGSWMKGTWCDGTWCDGNWHSGIWFDGTWRDGMWYGGTWEGGVWSGGRWVTGVWKGAFAQHQRFRHSPILNIDKTITIGSRRKTRDEWDVWFTGTEEYDTPRDSEEFKLLIANYKSFITYAEELNLIPKK